MAAIAALTLVLAACGGTAPGQQTASPGGGAESTPGGGGGPIYGTATPASGGAGGAGGGGGAAGPDCIKPGTNAANGSVEGSIVSTGAYAATWTFVVGNNGIAIAIGGGSGRIGLTANTAPGALPGPGADLAVDSAGKIEFGGILAGATNETVPPNAGQIFDGSGAQTTFCTTNDPETPSYLCAVTVDNDVVGTTDSNAKLHLKGTLTIKGTMPTTLGVTITCPG